LIEKIKAIGSVNQEIINRINTQGEERMQTMSYSIHQKESENKMLFFVEENVEETCGSTIIASWKKDITLKIPIDLFNDKLDYKCSTFEDIVRLNTSMLFVIEKYTFLDPKRAQSELEKFKNNFEVLQTCLGDIDGIFYNISNDSKLNYYRTELEDINQRFNNLLMNHDVIFGNKIDSWMTPCTSHTINKNSATLISGQLGCLLSNKGYNTGVRTWRLRVLSRTSTCMVGVAPPTVSKSGQINNYNTNGYYMDLNTGKLHSGPPFGYSARACAPSISGGSILTIILDCNAKTLTYNVDGTNYLAYEGLPMNNKLHLAWDNNTTPGSEIELI
jgi:hypothetical protein